MHYGLDADALHPGLVAPGLAQCMASVPVLVEIHGPAPDLDQLPRNGLGQGAIDLAPLGPEQIVSPFEIPHLVEVVVEGLFYAESMSVG